MKGDTRIFFFVTDYYLSNSVKSLERKGRADIGLLRMKISRRNQLRPQQLGKFLRLPSNKINLVKFLLHDWSKNTQHLAHLDRKGFYVTLEDKTFVISGNEHGLHKYPVPELLRP